MAEVLSVGPTHFPPDLAAGEYKPWPLARMPKGDRIPEHMKNPANWPEPMRKEWGDSKTTGKSSVLETENT